MMTTFEIALNQHKIPEFFKGEGVYFARGSDWGDHLYISNWQEMFSVLKQQKAAENLLTHVFEKYVKSLNEKYADAETLLCNIKAYYAINGKNSSLAIDNYDLIDTLDEKSKSIIGRVFRLLRLEYDKNRETTAKHTFEEMLERMKSNGCLYDFESF
ncbi:hypothetical protein ACW9H6_28930 [Pseudomonas sp. SDO528_S397]